MRQSRLKLAGVAMLIATLSVPVFARGHAGGGRSGGHAFSGARVAHVAPARHYAGRAAVGVFVGAAVVAPLVIAGPRYYAPPMRYYAPPPQSAYWYFCPAYNAYYPYVQDCPSGWQQVLARPY